jgi:hypothetical protein
MLLLDANKNKVSEAKVIDLQEEGLNTELPALSITKSLEPQAYGLDLSEVAF